MINQQREFSVWNSFEDSVDGESKTLRCFGWKQRQKGYNKVVWIHCKRQKIDKASMEHLMSCLFLPFFHLLKKNILNTFIDQVTNKLGSSFQLAKT